jgi:hypothetical protein
MRSLLLCVVLLALGATAFFVSRSAKPSEAAGSPAVPSDTGGTARASMGGASELDEPELAAATESTGERAAPPEPPAATPPEPAVPSLDAPTPADAQRALHDLSTEELLALAQDPNLSAEERIRALGLLRYREDDDGNDVRTAELVRSMIDLAALVPDGELRGDIWKAMEDCKDPQLVEPLIDALLYDASAEARSEAAETLGTFTGDPRVVSALQNAAENDPDPSVKKEAKGSLKD